MAKRVLFVEGNVDGTVGGSYFVMLDLVRNLDRNRLEPVIVFHRGNYLEDSFRECGVQVFVLPKAKSFVFRSQALTHAFWPVKKLINLYRRLLRPALSYSEFIRNHDIDLVSLNNSITRNHEWMIASRLARVPCLTHEMGINAHYSLASRWLGKRLGAVICVSRAVQTAMAAGGVSTENTCVIHNGIDLARYRQDESPDQLRLRHSIPQGAHVIGVVGNVREWKGQETIVRATALLKNRFPGIRCLLVGDSTPADQDYCQRLEQICQDLKIADNMVFTGYRGNAIDYMRLMDVVCHTSISPEPFGIVMLEAMSLAKPLVATNIGGPAEVVIPGQTGLLVEPGRPELLAAAIAELLANPARAVAMGAEGRKRLLSNFSLAKNVSQIMAIYERVIADQA